MDCLLAAKGRTLLANNNVACNQVHDSVKGGCTVVVEPGTYTLTTLAEVESFIAGLLYADGDVVGIGDVKGCLPT